MNPTQGVLLCCWGKVGYGYAAFNLAASIRYYSPGVDITLITDGHAISHLSDQHKSVFSRIEVTGEAVTDPGGFKTSIYERLPYDYTLFLDVDGLCLGPIEPLFDRLIAEYKEDPDGKFFRTHVYDFYDINSPVDMPMMYWARRDVIWDHYGFTHHRMPATQSSIAFIAKCDKAENFYKSLKNTYHNDYIPLEALKHKWGGTQPDELYLNVTLAQYELDPSIGDVMWFGDNGSLRPHQLKDKYYFLSLFGVRKRIKSFFITFYDQSLIKLLRQMGFANHYFKSHNIFADKHANTFVSPKKAERARIISEAPLQLAAESEIWHSDPGKKSIHLFTTYYAAATPRRQQELDKCLMANLDNKYISQVVLFSEIDVPIEHPKLFVLKTASRLTMKMAIEMSSGFSGDINILCNSDIYMNDTIGMVQDLNLAGIVLCLSRWEELPGGGLRHYSYEYSQDTWIWSGELEFSGGDYNFGLLGCDNKFAHDLWASGYSVFNPSRHIKTVHVHGSNVRSYSEATRLPRPYRNVPVCSIFDIPRAGGKLLINQPGKTGDILRVLPIASHYAREGYEVLWACPKQYHSLFDYVDYAKPVESAAGTYDKVIDISFGLNTKTEVHKRWLSERHGLDSFVTLKYNIAGVPVSECFNLQYERNTAREEALYNELGLGMTEYILIHESSDYGSPISVDSYKKVIKFSPISDYTIFDWRLVIERASEIHAIDSSLVNFADVIKTTGKLYYYITDRVPLQSDRTLLQKDWETINCIEGASV